MSERIMSRALALMFVAFLGAMTNIHLLLSVVPLYATSIGASGIGAGLATGVLMLSTVAAEFATPRLVARFGDRVVLAAGLILLGVPTALLTVSSTVATVFAASVVRGLGFGIIVVLGPALVASLVGPRRRGEALGLYGIVVGVPAVVALPLGIWLAGQVGYRAVFVAAAVLALAGLAVVPGLPRSNPEPSVGIIAGLRTGGLVRPAIVFLSITMTAGAIITFLPLAAHGISPAALLCLSAGATLTRWWVGRHGDRHGAARLFVPGVAVSAAGVLALLLLGSPVAVLAGMAVFGLGFGAAQAASLTVMFERVPPAGFGTASALWNLAYDAGLGLGATAFGVLAAKTGYPAAFACGAALIAAAIPLAIRDGAKTPVPVK